MKLINRNSITFLLIAIIGIVSNVNAQQNMTTESALSPKEQSIIAISSLTAKGDLVKLKTELNKGLEAGLTVNEIKEMIVHAYAYCGFPRSIRGLQTFMTVLDERKAKGINDEWGRDASLITDERSKYERGVETLRELTGRDWGKPESGYGAFAPVIDTFLKEHLFADIFERDVLTYQQRELVTLSVLSSIGGVEPMLQGHFNICLNIGLTPNQLQQFVNIIKTNVGKKESKAAQSVLNAVLQNNES